MKPRRSLAWVERRASGWRVRVYSHGAASRRRTLSLHPTEAEATRAATAWNAEVRAGHIVSPSGVSVADYVDQWLARREVHGSEQREQVRSAASERSLWRRHIVPSDLGKLAIDAIDRADVESFKLWLRKRTSVLVLRDGATGVRQVERDRPISRQTQRHVLRVLRSALEDARLKHLVKRNAADGVTVPAVKARDLADDWLRQPELEQLLSCEAISIRDRTVYAVAVGTALRLNDLKAIQIADVHLDAEVPGPFIRVDISKSDATHRVPILPWLAPWLRDHLATLPEGATLLFPNADGLVYSNGHDFGWAAKEQRAAKRVPSALERAKIGRRIRFHDLRGTTATLLALGSWGRRWSLHEVQSMLAHSDQRVTERYVRRALDVLSAAATETPILIAPSRPTGVRAGEEPTPTAPNENLASEDTNPERFERSTFGSGGPRYPRGSSVETAVGGDYGGDYPLADLARDLLMSPSGDAATLLARAVLDGYEPTRLALAVLDGGPHAMRRSIELAGLVLSGDVARVRQQGTSDDR